MSVELWKKLRRNRDTQPFMHSCKLENKLIMRLEWDGLSTNAVFMKKQNYNVVSNVKRTSQTWHLPVRFLLQTKIIMAVLASVKEMRCGSWNDSKTSFDNNETVNCREKLKIRSNSKNIIQMLRESKILCMLVRNAKWTKLSNFIIWVHLYRKDQIGLKKTKIRW